MSTWLRQLDADTLIVAGETTSGCVRASVVDAYSHGFRVAVVEEATFDRRLLCHKVYLFAMHLKYASVLHLDEALLYLAGARSDELEGARPDRSSRVAAGSPSPPGPHQHDGLLALPTHLPR